MFFFSEAQKCFAKVGMKFGFLLLIVARTTLVIFCATFKCFLLVNRVKKDAQITKKKFFVRFKFPKFFLSLFIAWHLKKKICINKQNSGRKSPSRKWAKERDKLFSFLCSWHNLFLQTHLSVYLSRNIKFPGLSF